MGTLVQFTPSASAVFTFNPTINGVQYIATVAWMFQAQRYYLTLTDLSGNVIVSRSICPSGPRLAAGFTWLAGIATAVCALPHLIPIGNVANIRVTDTDTGFDGTYSAMALNATTLTYSLPTNPQQSLSINGTVKSDLNLLGGYGIGGLVFYADTMQFEYFDTDD